MLFAGRTGLGTWIELLTLGGAGVKLVNRRIGYARITLRTRASMCYRKHRKPSVEVQDGAYRKRIYRSKFFSTYAVLSFK